MTDRPIIVSPPMIIAAMNDTKTMTRRLAWTKTTEIHHSDGPVFHKNGWECVDSPGDGFEVWGKPSIWQKVEPGDRLWVRERFARKAIGYFFPSDVDGTVYQSWSPSIHMPREASRMTWIVTGTKIERLQDISEADAKAEGAKRLPTPIMPDSTHRRGFEHLWNMLHGRGAWDANPEVVAITFIVHMTNIDRMAA